MDISGLMSVYSTSVEVFEVLYVCGRECDVCKTKAELPTRVERRDYADPFHSFAGRLGGHGWYPERWVQLDEKDFCPACYATLLDMTKNIVGLSERVAAKETK